MARGGGAARPNTRCLPDQQSDAAAIGREKAKPWRMPRRWASERHCARDEPLGLCGMDRGDSDSGGATPGKRRNVRGKASIFAMVWEV